MTKDESLKLSEFVGLELHNIQSKNDGFTLTFTGGKNLNFRAEPVGDSNSRAYIMLDDDSEIMAD